MSWVSTGRWDVGLMYFTVIHQRIHKWFTGSTVVLALCMAVVSEPLKTVAAPLGILSMQLAGTTAVSVKIWDSWSPSVRLWAAFGQGLDLLFLISYGTWFWLGGLWAAQRWSNYSPKLAWMISRLAWSAVLAAILDVFEDCLLMRVFVNEGRSAEIELVWWLASSKFLLIVIGLLTWLSGLFISPPNT